VSWIGGKGTASRQVVDGGGGEREFGRCALGIKKAQGGEGQKSLRVKSIRLIPKFCKGRDHWREKGGKKKKERVIKK